MLERRTADPARSHSARLLSRGTAKVAQKFGEEAVECLIEAVAEQPRGARRAKAPTCSTTCSSCGSPRGVEPDEVWAELHRREGISGDRREGRPAAPGRYLEDPLTLALLTPGLLTPGPGQGPATASAASIPLPSAVVGPADQQAQAEPEDDHQQGRDQRPADFPSLVLPELRAEIRDR